MNYNILHIHKDKKFISLSRRFNRSHFSNSLLYIGSDNVIDDSYFDKRYLNVSDIIECDDVLNIHAIVTYGIDRDFSYHMEKILSIARPIVINRIFGFEIYKTDEPIWNLGYLINKVYFEYVNKGFWPLISRLKKALLVKNKARHYNILDVDYVMTYFESEYNYMVRYLLYKGKMIRLPYNINQDKSDSIVNKLPNIIVGNSRNSSNRHDFAIDIIHKSQKKVNYHNIIIPCSYGNSGYYWKRIFRKLSSLQRVTLLDKFLLRDDYLQILTQSAALVNNASRQSGLGNMFAALGNGVKVYLNPDNVIYDEIQSHGIIIFSIHNLYLDIVTNNIYLSIEDSIHNRDALQRMSMKRVENDFIGDVIQAIGNRFAYVKTDVQ